MNLPRNEVKPPEEEPRQQRRKKAGRESRLGRTIRSILDGSILTREHAVRLLPFSLFLGLMFVVYIANSYYADKITRRTDKIHRELKELEFEYITSKSELMQRSQQSELARMLDSLSTGIEESLEPPFKIFINQNEFREKKK
jgi:hypothetical protein